MDDLHCRLATLDHYIAFGYAVQMLYMPCEQGPPNINHLRASLDRLMDMVPILRGNIEPSDHPGRFVIRRHHYTVSDVFTVVDRSLKGFVDYAAWSSQGFPQDALEPFSTYTPRAAFALPPATVLQTQLNVVSGGAALCWMVHHTVVDGHGSAQLLKAWAALCRGEELVELLFDRNEAWKSLNKSATSMEMEPAGWKQHPEYYAAQPGEPYPRYKSHVQRVFRFSQSSLQELKTRCSGVNDRQWISTNDALCALMWTRVSAVRVACGVAAARRSTLGLSVDVRPRVEPPLSENYIGNATYNTITQSTIGDLGAHDIDTALRATALLVRDAVQKVNHNHIASGLALLDNLPDLSQWRAAQWDTDEADFDVTSWARQPTLELDWGSKAFGAGAKFDAIRLPWHLKAGIAFVLPSASHGKSAMGSGVEVSLRLLEDQMLRLVQDQVFMSYVDRISH